jgi:hypothetical protein
LLADNGFIQEQFGNRKKKDNSWNRLNKQSNLQYESSDSD